MSLSMYVWIRVCDAVVWVSMGELARACAVFVCLCNCNVCVCLLLCLSDFCVRYDFVCFVRVSFT